jgi:hypothetical protein
VFVFPLAFGPLVYVTLGTARQITLLVRSVFVRTLGDAASWSLLVLGGLMTSFLLWTGHGTYGLWERGLEGHAARPVSECAAPKTEATSLLPFEDHAVEEWWLESDQPMVKAAGLAIRTAELATTTEGPPPNLEELRELRDCVRQKLGARLLAAHRGPTTLSFHEPQTSDEAGGGDEAPSRVRWQLRIPLQLSVGLGFIGTVILGTYLALAGCGVTLLVLTFGPDLRAKNQEGVAPHLISWSGSHGVKMLMRLMLMAFAFALWICARIYTQHVEDYMLPGALPRPLESLVFGVIILTGCCLGVALRRMSGLIWPGLVFLTLLGFALALALWPQHFMVPVVGNWRFFAILVLMLIGGTGILAGAWFQAGEPEPMPEKGER